MSLVAPRNVLIACLRHRALSKGSIKPYHCFVLSNFNTIQYNHPRTCRFAEPSLGKTTSYSVRHLSRYCSTDSKSEDKKSSTKEEKLSLFQRFKQMYRNYWYVLVPVHLVTSAAWFGSFYYLASSGVDIPALLETMHVSEKIIDSMRNSSMGYVAIAYGLYKITTPVRYTVTLGGTTISINYLTKWGYIKPIPSTERLKEIYEETKDGMKEKKENLIETVHNIQQSVKETKEGIKEKKENLIETVHNIQQSVKDTKEGFKEKKENLMEAVHNIQQSVKDTKEGIKEKKDSLMSSVKESKKNIKSIKEKVISNTHKNQNKS